MQYPVSAPGPRSAAPPPPRRRRSAAAAAMAGLLAVPLLAAAPGAAAAAPQRVAYGRVVVVSARAVLLALANGRWIALNATPQTAVFASAGGRPARVFSGVAAGDWMLAYYGLATRSVAGRPLTWLDARLVRYAAGPFALGGPTRLRGRVTAVFAQGFSLAARGRTWLVYVTPGTRFASGGAGSAFALLQARDVAVVAGTAAGDTVSARSVNYLVPAPAPRRAPLRAARPSPSPRRP